MVSIKKAKQGFSLRQRGRHYNNNFTNNNNPLGLQKESIGLLVGGICVGFLVIILWQSMGTDEEVTRLKVMTLRNEKPHPHLIDPSIHGENKPMPDRFNAVALDILETLDCQGLFETYAKNTKNNNNNNNNNGFDDGFPNEQREAMDRMKADDIIDDKLNRRRRLDDQHGDDGGFDLKSNHNAYAAAQQASDPEDDDDKPLPDQEEEWGGNNNNNYNVDDQSPQGGGMGWDDQTMNGSSGDYGGDFDNDYSWQDVVTAQHLFCLAASQDPPSDIQSQLKCDATTTKRKTLLDLWSSARAQMMDVSILKKTLVLGHEHQSQVLLNKNYNFWAPNNDDGFQYMLNSLNSELDADNGGIHGLHQSLGENSKVFVDVGSCLGLTCLAIHDEYPGTTIISIEPAFPNWLYQELNVRCNIDEEDDNDHKKKSKFKIMLSGVGPNTEDEDYLMAKLMWRPTATTSTRAWTPHEEEHPQDDVELVVRLQRLKQILAEAGVYDINNVNVLNVDCEGCEYNLIPAMTEEEFEAIPTVMGGVHWGYIPITKLPSSERGRQTHERLCSHENIAKSTKECCAFPDLPVKSSVPGEVLQKAHDDDDKAQQQQQNHRPIIGGIPQTSTVQDVVEDGLCDNFEEWSKEHFLNDVPDDWGWMELSSQA